MPPADTETGSAAETPDDKDVDPDAIVAQHEQLSVSAPSSALEPQLVIVAVSVELTWPGRLAGEDEAETVRQLVGAPRVG